MRLKKIGDFDIYRNESWYCGPGPSPIVFPDGEIIVGFRRTRSMGHGHPAVEACLVRSKDAGETWSSPEVFDYGPIRNINLTLLSDGTLIMLTPSSELVPKSIYEQVVKRHQRRARWIAREVPDNPSRGSSNSIPAGEEDPERFFVIERGPYVRHSTDRGKSWGQRYYVDDISGWPSVLPGFSSPLQLRGRVVELSDGTLVIPAAGVDINSNDLEDCNPIPILVSSSNGGKDWAYRGTIAKPEEGSFDETEVIEHPSGKITSFMRPWIDSPPGDKSSRDKGMFINTTTSHDKGRTWSPVNREEIWGYPTSAMFFNSGNILLTYGYRRPPIGIRGLLTDPECTDIKHTSEIIIRDDGSVTDLGYPQAAVLPDGKALVTYYMNDKNDQNQTRYIGASILEEE